MSVKHYLDCGCAIMDDGRREWCPSCVGGQPKVTQDAERVQAAALDMLNALSAARAYLWGELCKLNISTAANHPTAHLYCQVERAIEAATLGPEGRRG